MVNSAVEQKTRTGKCPLRASKTFPRASLTPWGYNARTHSKKQIRQIADSIRAFGFTNPVLIDAEHRILAGHGRVAAAKLLELATVPCLRIDHMTPAEKRARSSPTTSWP